MSGRRSSNSEGTPTGISGGVPARGVAGMEKSEAGFPISTAIACSSCARWTPTLMSWACVVLSWVSACSTSASESTPWLYSPSVRSRDFWKAATVSVRSCFCASSSRN